MMSSQRFVAPKPYNEAVKEYAPESVEREALTQALREIANTKAELTLPLNRKAKPSLEGKVVMPCDFSHTLALYQPASKEDVSFAIDTAVNQQKEWSMLPWEERAAVFLKAADLLATKYRYRMNAATMLGQSKTAHQAEIDSACELIDFLRFNVHFMEQILNDQPISSPGVWNRTFPRGLEGFVYAITPFNFTAIAVNLPCAPALMGCSVLWKPASTNLLAAHLALDILHEAGLPEGVISLVQGDPVQISNIALQHRELAGVHFTGSTTVFQNLWKTIGNNIDHYKSYPRVVGETGGKDFVFAHSSADADHLANSLIRGAFEYQGQKCSAASRAYIPESLWPKLKEQLCDITRSIDMGDVRDFRNFVGAVIDEKAFKRIKSYIDHAHQASDAEVIVGGDCSNETGFFIRPTIIEAKSPHYASMSEEIFGPVLSVYVYQDSKFEETLALCDQTSPYALTGAIFARDRAVVHKMSNALANAAGNFYINDKPTGAVVGQQPFGGGRASGTNDKAGSKINLLRWCSMRTIKENFIPIKDYRYPYMGDRIS